MRTKEELQRLLSDVANWYVEDTGETFSLELLRPILEEISKERRIKFVQRRLAHLKDLDWFNLMALIEDGKRAKATKKV